jgi:putative heme-binding domain-containing protein
MKCHAIGGAGGLVGPDLVSVGASAQSDYLIESLIEPNKKVKENFHTKMFLLDTGKIVGGIPVRENGSAVVVRDAEDREIQIQKASIEESEDGRSLMPDGLVDGLTRAELVDLARFLSELGKVGDFAIGKQRVVRRWQSLVWTNEGHRRLNRTSHDTAATTDPALTWRSEYSRVSGELPVQSFGKFVVHRGNDPTSFVRFEVEVSTPGKLALAFNSTVGLRCWYDGKPTPIEDEMIVDSTRGRHTVTLAVNQAEREQSLKVELRDVEGSAAKAQIVGGK